MINMAFVCYYMKCSKRRLSDIPSSEWISSFRYREKDNPDLVVLDMKIPGMDGIEILKHVKEIDESIKVILMTAYGKLDMIQEAKDLGALMHFAKPFDIDEIRQAVRNELAVEA